jgi:multidrug resistance efflux pump
LFGLFGSPKNLEFSAHAFGGYVTVGTRMLSTVPVDDLRIEANCRDTRIGRMKIADPVRIGVDT